MGIFDQFSHPRGVTGKLLLRAMNAGHTPMITSVINAFDWKPDSDILDIGCGGGISLKLFSGICPRGHITGVDASAEAVVISRALAASLGNVNVLKAEANCLPFGPCSFDNVTAFETALYWHDRAACFKEVRRVLRPGGRFIIADDMGRHAFIRSMVPGLAPYTADEMADMMSVAGFEGVSGFTRGSLICTCGMNTKLANNI